MPKTCTRCDGSGFLNLHQIDDKLLVLFEEDDFEKMVLRFIDVNDDCDVQICDCCGDGEEWYGTPGEHYNTDDPAGFSGPYGYNGGYCECH